MPAQSNTTQVIIPRTLVIYKRERSDIWQCRYKVGGAWIRASTGEYDQKLAAQRADRMRIEAEVMKQKNLPAETRYFKHVAENVIRQMQDDIDAGHGKVIYKDYIYVIKKYFIPIFKKHKMSGIDAAAMKMFDEQRLAMMRKAPSKSTLQNHNAALNMIFDYAVERGYMARSKVPVLKAKGKKSEPRPPFNLDETALVLFKFDEWIDLEKNVEKREMKELLKDYVSILVDTGLRAGKEPMNLRWQQIEYKSDTKKIGEEIVEHGVVEAIYETKDLIYMKVTGKNKTRDARGNKRAIDALQRILNRNYNGIKLRDMVKKNNSDKVIALKNGKQPRYLAKLFQEYLIYLGILLDPKTNVARTPYSLRHTYSTLALENDAVPMHTLTKQLGNSMQMVEQHYSHLQIRNAQNQLDNDNTAEMLNKRLKALESGFAFDLDEEDKQEVAGNKLN